MKNIIKRIQNFRKNKKEKELSDDNKEISRRSLWIVLICFVIGGMVLLFSRPDTFKVVKIEDILETETEEMGVFVGDVDEKIYLSRIEKNYYTVNDRIDRIETTLAKLEQSIESLNSTQKKMAKIMQNMDGGVTKKIEKRFEMLEKLQASKQKAANIIKNVKGKVRGFNTENITIKRIKINEISNKKNQDNTVYLPIGSFVKATLLTGVYAPADDSNPLPVVIALTEAFYGPNKTRVPLTGAFAVGKAHGDVVSKRAYVQIIAISTVLPDGSVFEKEQNIGYLTDIEGNFGIPGQVIRNTGKELGMSFLGGFMAGVAQAFSDSESTSIVGSNGQVQKIVTGDVTKHSAFQGLATSATTMSEYYQKQIDNLVPAIKVDNMTNGRKTEVYFIVQKGIRIDGLQINFKSSFNYID